MSTDPHANGLEVDDSLGPVVDLLSRRRRAADQRMGRAAITRAKVVEVAIHVADAEGIEAVSMRGVARQLGVGTMTLYRYVADRDALLTYMTNSVLAFPFPEQPTKSWRRVLDHLGHAFRQVCLRHPWLAAVLGTSPFLVAPSILGTSEVCIEALEAAGLDVVSAGAIVRLVNNYVIGASLRDAIHARSTQLSDDYEAAATSYTQQLIASGRYPAMGRLAQIIRDGGDLGIEARFDLGLHCLLDGVEIFIAATVSSTPSK